MKLPALRRPRAYLLITVLGFSAALAGLMLAWMWQGQSLSQLGRRSQLWVDRHLSEQDTLARMGTLLTSPSKPPTLVGNVSLAGDFESGAEGSPSRSLVRWGRNSLRYPTAREITSYDNLFGSGKPAQDPQSDLLPRANTYGPLPLLGYDRELIGRNGEGLPLAPGHILMQQEKMGGPDCVAVIDRAFPFAAYAPGGSVSLQSCYSWSNPTLEESQQHPERLSERKAYATGLPVVVRSRDQLQVSGELPCGRLLSVNGPILKPQNSPALAYSGSSWNDPYCAGLSQQLEQIRRQLSQGTLEKAKWIRGKGLSIAGIRNLLKGASGSFEAFFTVEQACQFPIPPLPSFKEDVLVAVLAFHVPYPADFTGDSQVDQSDIDELKKIHDESERLRKEVGELEERQKGLEEKLSGLQQQLNNPNLKPDDKEALQKQIDDVRQSIEALDGQIKDKNQELEEEDKQGQKIADHLQQERDRLGNNTDGYVPQNAWEDATAPVGSGWAYVQVLKVLTRALFDSKGGDALDRIIPPCRLVHLGAMDPGFSFSDKSLGLKGTVNVPAGKTMKLGGVGTVELEGDLWIQRGATCFVDANLNISKAMVWKDFKGVEAEPSNPKEGGEEYAPVDASSESPDGSTNPLYPWGRIILEEGATLVVSGDLNVTGGNVDTGSVVCCSRLGGNRPINTALLVGGDVKITHGIYSGMSLEDLTYRLAKDGSSGVSSLYADFLDPFMNAVSANLCKVLGPWDQRKPYFARYATTFVFMEFLAEFGLAEIPFPIPLPVANLDRDIFEWLSTLYSVELNLTLGENFVTESWWWLLGRGVAPVFLKVPPEAVLDAFAGLDYAKITVDTLKEAFDEFLKEVIPEIVKAVINEFLVELFKTCIEEVFPGPDVTPRQNEVQDATERILKKLEEELKKIVGEELKKNFLKIALNIVNKVRADITREASGEANSNYFCREVPGVLVYSGGSMEVGEPGNAPGAFTALGFFYAEKDLEVAARKIVGSLVSHRGSITAWGELLYYPYFTEAHLYLPPKPAEYDELGGWVPTDDLRNAFQFTVPRPKSLCTLDLSPGPSARVTATGELP